MTRDELKTYREWAAVRRAVRRGEVAHYYLLSPDEQDRLALFSLEQTEEIADVIARETWTKIVPASEAPAKPKHKSVSDGRPKIRVEYNTSTQQVSVWAGPCKEAIQILRKGKYTYHAGTHRWVATRPSIDKVVDGLEARRKFNVIVVIDGVPS